MKKRGKRRMNKPAAQVPTESASSSEIPILQEAEQKIESQMTPETRQNYMKIVVAGMKAGLAGGPNGVMGKLAKNPDPISACATGALGLAFILKGQAKGVMPMKALVPAAMTLMLKALDFVDKTGIAQVGPTELDRAATTFRDTLLKKIGVTPQMIQKGLINAHKLSQDPVAMEQLNRKAGVVKHPMASEPTPLPPAGAS